VDLAPHRSIVVSEDLVRDAGVILVFDRDNWETMTTRFPFARSKIHRLADLVVKGETDIHDPYGHGLDDFRVAYRLIVASLDASRPA
jgi:protein-tyrosine-phosphatase